MRAWLPKLCALSLALGCAGAFAPASNAAVGPGSLEQRVQPCMACHGKEGRATSEGFYPRIAGKPAGYLFNQLVNFRTGRRHFPMMVYMTMLQQEPYLREMAAYFASQQLPYPPPSPPGVSSDVLEHGRALVTEGDAARGVPSCRACHGMKLLGVEPDVPGLLGLSRDYLVAQLTAWRIGIRRARAPDCMAEVVRRLSASDVNAATAWLASQSVPAGEAPEPGFARPPPLKCGSFATPADAASAESASSAAAPDRAASGGPGPVRAPPAAAKPPPAAASGTEGAVLRQGRELVTLGGCYSCHTQTGGAPFAGGRPIPTPFGTFYSPNITPDPSTGIGRWSAEDFWRALHEGVSRDGRSLYPTFPYTNYTRVTRTDADAMFAYLKSLPPAAQPDHAQDIRFPYDVRALLAGWRLLYFTPGVYRPEPARGPQWNRGAYLVQGLGHCSACHEARNSLGATRSASEPIGQLVLDWYAPSLFSSLEAGVQGWSLEDIGRLLATGVVGVGQASNRHAAAMGPMAEVVHDSLQFADPGDLRAMAVYLRSLPDERRRLERFAPEALAGLQTITELGRKVYAEQCARCHGDHGEGRPPAGAPLAGNRVVTMPQASDPIRILLFGGYPPGTTGDPRPFGMPPFYPILNDDQLADVLTYIRTSWGNDASPVFAAEFAENRGSPLW
jgi:cytochrome c553